MGESEKTMKKVTLLKQFRLIDFHVFDESTQSFDDSSSEEDKKKFKKDEMKFIIQMFGVNEKGETCSISIQDFQPFFYVKVGKDWTEYHVNAFLREIRSKIDKKYGDSILSVSLVEYQKLYGFSAGKLDKFIKIIFQNTIVMNRVKNLWFQYIKEEDRTEERAYRKRVPFWFQNTNLELY